MSNPFLQSLFLMNKFLIPSVFIYSFPEFQFPRPFRRNPHLNHRKSHIILSSFILSHHLFVTGVLHGGSSWFNSFFKCSSRFLSKELKYLSFLFFEVQLNLHILLKWNFAFLRSSKLSNNSRLWPVITLWSWDVIYKTTTSLLFSLLIFSTTLF